MKNRNYMLLTTLAAGVLLSGAIPSGAQTSGGAKGGAPARAASRIMVNGKPVDGDVSPVFVGDKVMVPVRFVTEYLGGEADWNAKTRVVTLTSGRGEKIVMTIGSNMAKYQGEGRALSQAPLLLEGRTLIPLKEVARLMGVRADYNYNSRVVFITAPNGSLEPPMRRMTRVPVNTSTEASNASPTAATTKPR
jgi:hypothetical protein